MARHLMEGYPFSLDIQVRWRDLDGFEHVNNAVFASWLEVARAELWHQRFGGRVVRDIPFVIARLEIDFRRPVQLYDDVRIGLRPADVGATSFAFEYRIEAGGRLAANARTVQVCVRPETGRPVRVPEEIRQRLADLTAGA
jgi:acyl-CoA thioester hydrolase